MPLISRTRPRATLPTVAFITFMVVALATPSSGGAQGPPPRPSPVGLPDEAAGTDAAVRALLDAFDHVDIIGLGEVHGRKGDSDLRIALIRHPDFPRKVRSIVVEFASTTEQPALHRYIGGGDVSRAQLERVWKTTSNGEWDSPVYAGFFAAVREVNARLPVGARLRVLGGDPGPTDQRDRETAAAAVIEEAIRSGHGKALVIYGAAHFYRAAPPSFGASAELARMLERAHPGRILTIIPLGGDLDAPPPGAAPRPPDYRKFERGLSSPLRPVLIPLQRLPFRDLSAEEFLGGGIFSCLGPGGCRSAFAGSLLTLGQMADASLYFGIPQAGPVTDPPRRH